MDLRQLEYLVAVAEEASFTRAAERVHISQSGVSAQIRQLERELGAELFDRTGRAPSLTTAGAAALPHARAALASAAAVREAVADVTTLVRGHLTVGMVTACTVEPLFAGLAGFHAAHPGVEITLVEDGSDRLVEGVRRGSIDLALVGTAGAAPQGLATTTIISEPLVACTLPDHPLTTRSRVRLRDVVGHPIACLPPGTGIRSVLDGACAAAGLRPTLAVEASAPAAVLDLAARGLGVAVLSESMAASDGRLTSRRITDVRTPAVLSLAWRDQPAPALRVLVEHQHRAFGTPLPTSA